MGKKAISIVLALALAGSAAGCAAGSRPAASVAPNAAKLALAGDSRYKSLRLTPEIYNASNDDLSDLLIIDSAGESVPYFIHTGYRRAYASREAYPMVLVDSYVKDDCFYFDYKLAAPRSGDAVATSLEFATPSAGFAKEVALYGSYDNIYWEFVQNDKLYSIDGVTKLSIEFAQARKYTHYRLMLANNLERISFDAVSLVYRVEISEESNFIESLEPAFTVGSGGRATNIAISGLRNLRLYDVTIHTGSMFKRYARTPHGVGKELYNLSFSGMSYTDTAIPLNWSISHDDEYVVILDDGDDKPIAVDSITVRYYADEVVFEGKAGESYILEFGRDASKRAPVYDIERYKSDVLRGPIDKASISEILYAPEQGAPARDYRLLFNIVIVAVALLLGAVIVLKLRKGAP
ncbi:MAG: DUF3999 domain-containing protein [Clostridiales bacterium]|nr:DUF3999 domain-containing protein [Clostridiales bacterium]